jgi:hypothetical protein
MYLFIFLHGKIFVFLVQIDIFFLITTNINTRMRYMEFAEHIHLQEQPVMSSWISDLTLQNNNADVTMALGNGRRYAVRGVGPTVFQQWVTAPSKGKFWHGQIRGNYTVTRLI